MRPIPPGLGFTLFFPLFTIIKLVLLVFSGVLHEQKTKIIPKEAIVLSQLGAAFPAGRFGAAFRAGAGGADRLSFSSRNVSTKLSDASKSSVAQVRHLHVESVPGDLVSLVACTAGPAEMSSNGPTAVI